MERKNWGGRIMKPVDLDELWQAAQTLDLTGLKCPMPALIAARALRDSPHGTAIAVRVTDPLAPLDLRHLCDKEGHTVLAERKNENGALLLIRSRPRGSFSAD